MRNRFLIVFMSMCMIVGTTPVTTFAEETEEEVLVCHCNVPCTEDSVDLNCNICMEDYSRCESQEAVLTEICNCETLCEEESINMECEVCSEDDTMCIGEKRIPSEDEKGSDKIAETEDAASLEYNDYNENNNVEGNRKSLKNTNDTINLFEARDQGTSMENPIEVPIEGMVVKNGIYYGIDRTWYEQINREKQPLYFSIQVPDDVREIAKDGFTDQWSREKEQAGAVVNHDGDGVYTNKYVVAAIDFSNATELKVIETQAAMRVPLEGILDLSKTRVVSIGKNAFKECTGLTGVILPDTLSDLGNPKEKNAGSVFYGCTNLRFVTTKEKYEEVESAGNLDTFTDLTFPDGLKFIGNQCFQNAFQPGLELAVTIPASVETIGSQAFYNADAKEIRFSQFIVERTYDSGLKGYDYAAFKWRNDAAKDKVCLIIMADQESYDYFLNDNNGLNYVENAVTYPMDVQFKNGSATVATEHKLYKQYIQYEWNASTGVWARNTDYKLPKIPGDIEPKPGYKGSIWTMDGKELTVDSKVTSDTVTLRAGGELEDPIVTFLITAIPKNGETRYATMTSGQVLTLSINEYQRIDIVPEITHALAGNKKDDIFFWYKWNDSTDVRDQESAFRYGARTNTLKIDDLSDARTDSHYYQLDLDGRKVSSSWGPSYNWDQSVYTSSDQQYYIKINLTQSPENLAYVSASEYQYFVDNKSEYMLNTVYETSDKLISEYLYRTFGEKTFIESETYEENSLSIDWKQKDGSAYTAEPGKTNTFVWTASQDEFNALGWTNTENIPLAGELIVQNPYSITFIADGNTADVKYLTKLGTLAAADFPPVPEKRGYAGVWNVTEDIIKPVSNIVVTANYTPVTYSISYDLDGGENDSSNPVNYTVENDIVLKNPTRSGYSFAGWTYGNQNEPKKDLTLLAGSITGDLLFTAHWNKNSNDDASSGGSHTSNTYYVRYHNDNDTKRDGKFIPGETVTVKGDVFTAPVGKVLAGWSLEEDGEVDYKVGDVFRMPGSSVDLYAVWKDAETESHSAYISGYPDGTVGPDKTITRAEAATMFYNLLADKNGDTKTFTDVPANQWYTKAVTTLAGKGVISGYPDGTFKPHAPITRAEFVTMAMNFADAGKGTACSFLDVPQNMWYYGAIAGATQNAWICGYPDGTFKPDAWITRAEATSVMNRMENRAADLSFIADNLEDLRTFNDLTMQHWAYGAMIEAANGHDYTREAIDTNEVWIDIH